MTDKEKIKELEDELDRRELDRNQRLYSRVLAEREELRQKAREQGR